MEHLQNDVSCRETHSLGISSHPSFNPVTLNFASPRQLSHSKVLVLMALPVFLRIAIGAFLATALAVRGRRKKSLSSSGAVAAWFVGFTAFASGVRFGMTLLTFYLSGTRVTRYRADYKRRIEDGFSAATGNRSAKQVLASSLPAVVLSVMFSIRYVPHFLISTDSPFGSQLLLAFLLFFAACAGDTFSSELGIAAPDRYRDPVLILAPWRSVPRGTNGGITPFGTLGSIIGGFIMGVSFFLTGPKISVSQAGVILVGTLGGLIGSMLDSILGMLVQSSWLDPKSGKVLKDTPPISAQEHLQHICGRDLLSGESVNVLSAVLTTTFAPVMLSAFFGGSSTL